MIVQALQRIAITRFILTHPFLKAEIRVLEMFAPPSEASNGRQRSRTCVKTP